MTPEPDEQRKAAGAALRKRRKEAGLTQGEMALRIGVKTSTYVNWELGRTIPSSAAQKNLDEELASLEGKGKVYLSFPISPKARKTLEMLAKENGTTLEQEIAKVLECIYGACAVAATDTGAEFMTLVVTAPA